MLRPMQSSLLYFFIADEAATVPQGRGLAAPGFPPNRAVNQVFGPEVAHKEVVEISRDLVVAANRRAARPLGL